jgi:transcriptional regulator with XRE-family HTH domain
MPKRRNAIDLHVSERVRVARVALGLTQELLAEKLGVSYQQVQKYERGTNRVSAGRLYQISQVLNLPLMYFFEGAPKSRIK